jgi:outer membrane biosynthesis protein TonB
VRRGGDCVVVLDFRVAQGRPGSAAQLREAVAEESRREGRAEPGDLRFLVVDTPAGLTANAGTYELVMGYPTLGAVHVLCLAVGDLPEDIAPTGSAPTRERRLRVASVLRTSTTGVLWAADPPALGLSGAAGDGAAAEGALAVLVDLLRTPEVFDEVLAALLRCPAAAAAPAVHVLEHDLAPAVRDRAWREALERFAGRADTATATPPPRDLPGPLAELTRTTGEPSAAPLRRPGGAADTVHGTCVRALAEAEAARDELAGPGGLLTGRRAARALPRALAEAARALGHYRDLVVTALRESGTPGIPPGEAALRLADAGIDPPPDDRARRRGGDPGDTLQQYAAQLLTSGLALRTVAGRLAALSQQVAPLPAGGRVAELERSCPDEVLRRTSTGHRLTLATARAGALAPVAGAALLGALWPWPGTLLVLLPLALLLCAGLLATAANPGRAAGGRTEQAAGAQTAAAVAGTAVGAAVGWALDVPAWAGLAGVVLAVPAVLALTALRWRRAVDEWWDATGAAELRRALAVLDAGLAEAVHQQWWAAEERTRCADGARLLAGVLRGAAAGMEPGGTRPAPEPYWPPDDADPDDPGWTPEPGAYTEPEPAGAYPQWDDDSADTDAWDTDPDGTGPDATWDWPQTPQPPHAPTAQTPTAARTPQPQQQPQPQPEPQEPELQKPEPQHPHPQQPTGVEAVPPDPAPAGPGPATAPAWLDRDTGDGGPDLLATLTADLADATAEALRRHWGAADRSTGGDGPAATLETAVRRAIEAVHHHLERNGVVPAPPSARRERHRGDPMSLLGIGVHRVREALDPEASGVRLLPLCTAGQLALLSRDPTAAQLIRIAPDAVRSALDGPLAGGYDGGYDDGYPESGRAVWTASGRFAGAMRLTSLRSGVVETVRTRAWADTPPGPDAPPAGPPPGARDGARPPADTATHARTYADEGARTAPDDRRSGGRSTW